MSLADLEATTFAYYLVSAAPDLNIAGRFFPYNDLIMIIEDKIQIGTRKFGPKPGRNAKPVAQRFLDIMIEQGAFSVVKNEWGGTMHQFQGDAYKTALKQLHDNDPIIQEAAAGGADFWPERFAAAMA